MYICVAVEKKEGGSGGSDVIRGGILERSEGSNQGGGRM